MLDSRPVLRTVARVLIAVQVLVTPVRANPEGATVVAGQVTIDQSRASLTHVHQSTDRAIINWQGFSNAAGETVRFSQPSATSAILNRVTGNRPP